jgi:hypothetical protein
MMTYSEQNDELKKRIVALSTMIYSDGQKELQSILLSIVDLIHRDQKLISAIIKLDKMRETDIKKDN